MVKVHTMADLAKALSQGQVDDCWPLHWPCHVLHHAPFWSHFSTETDWWAERHSHGFSLHPLLSLSSRLMAGNSGGEGGGLEHPHIIPPLPSTPLLPAAMTFLFLSFTSHEMGREVMESMPLGKGVVLGHMCCEAPAGTGHTHTPCCLHQSATEMASSENPNDPALHLFCNPSCFND